MKGHKWALCAAVGALLLCAGCQLAKPEADQAPEPDQLIGVYVTREYLDTLDLEGYLNDHPDLLNRGGIELSPGQTAPYEKRITAQRAGDEYVFEGLEGMALFAPLCEVESARPTVNPTLEEDGGGLYSHSSDVYRATRADDGIVTDGMHLTYTDDEDRIELTGTIYVISGSSPEFYCNPVYQTAAGDVYLTGGSGISSNGQTEGETFSQTVDSSVTVTENGQTRTRSCKATMRFEVVYEPVNITIIQMDRASQVLRRESFAPDQVPERLALEPGCAYIVAETERLSPAGETVLSRQLADAAPAEDGEPAELLTFRPREDGICLQQRTALIPSEEDVP